MIVLMAASIQLYAKKRRLDKEKQLAASQAKDEEMTGQLSA
jgi:hypothetical protein